MASEQLWPNIQSLVHWHNQLQLVCIYYTEDKLRSKEPAQKLKQFCQQYAPHVAVLLPDYPLGMQPSDVTQQVRKWRKLHPDLHWFLNATGGTKLMTAGMLHLIGEPKVTIVYKELESGWFELVRDQDGQSIKTRPLPIVANETDCIPVKLLLDTCWGGPEWLVQTSNPPEALPILDIIETAASNQWDWLRAFQACGAHTQKTSGGMLFEDLVAAILLEMGVTNVVCNASRKSVQGDVVQEVDIVINHGGRLNIIDCKLRNRNDENRRKVESVTSQIRQAAQTRKDLGGLGARLLLLRPNRVLSETEHQLAQYYGLEVIDAKECTTFITKLAHFFGVERLNETLHQAEQIIKQKAEQSLVPGFGPKDPIVELCEQSCEIGKIINLDELSEKIARDGGNPWVAYFCPPDVVFIRCKAPENVPKSTVEKRIKALVYNCGHVKVRVERSSSGCTDYVFLTVKREQYNLVRKLLQSHFGRSLWDG
jgi:predicted RecB family endonuclease